ncbi:hypothetical protein [Breznakiella homolactica]|uniref:Uncharacterized protein n=1 Tax=Breznakiella homolactica TaxID=2798577 RepID=A0A7T8BAD0_9SPIR|nr:hypothetical protein [Breznakiella homolactica]QQO09246.1 hypothetical protein JFL75_20330 [Breznakiella homolactica]
MNDRTLADHSFIFRNDTLRPAFLNSVDGDPDVTGLLVFFETPEGNAVSEKVRYLLPSGEESPSYSGETVITVNSLDESLAVFTLPDNLEPGQYVMVFHILGKRDVLYKSSQTVYYLEDYYCSVEDIRMYLPGVSSGPYLIMPGLTILLETELNCDPEIDPYIIWYSNGKRIDGGTLSEGKNRVLWTAPGITGFTTIRAEVFPFTPKKNVPKNAAGYAKDLSIPVSSKARIPAFYADDGGQCVYWYQFTGNLEAAKAPNQGGRVLIKAEDSPLRWEVHEDLYGLAVGPADVYTIPDFSLSFGNSKTGFTVNKLNIHFVPRSSGTVARGLFSLDSGRTLEMEISVTAEGVLLAAGTETEKHRITLPAAVLDAGEIVDLALMFSLTEKGFAVSMYLDGAETAAEELIIPLNESLNGSGVFSLGAENSGSTGSHSGGIVALIDEVFLEQLSAGNGTAGEGSDR